MEPVEDRNLEDFEPLISPRAVKERLPITDAIAANVRAARLELRALIRGEDTGRLLVIVGPCSIHDPEAAYEYAGRLLEVRKRSADALYVLMRTYFEKPRTTVGWKGLINDPHLDGSCDIATGLVRAREIMLKINQLGMPCAGEALDPITPQYTSDLMSWSSIGARTTESQTHREMASGLSMPVGFKNGTDGSLAPARNALISAGHPHSFVGINADGQTSIIKTRGNPDRHIVLRGGERPNYSGIDVQRAVDAVTKVDAGAKRPVLIDTSHGNSGKDFRMQPTVVREVLTQFENGQRGILGFLMESHLNEGRQDWSSDTPLEYGVSITDGCMGWETTEALLDEMARRVRSLQ